MAVITIREQGQTEKGYNATLVIDGNNYNITVSDPFEPKEEQELEWYFEQWLRYPILEQVKANRAKESVRKYGEELFEQVFQKDINAYSKYSQLRSNLGQLQIEIESITPEFHAIHWEALQDPDLPRPLAVDSVLIRKNVKPAVIEANVNESPTINLLVVVARPKADRDIPHRTISRPLVEAIRNAKLRVNIELLRPGTYKALERHLESKGNGYYHIVHFDVHGSLQTYETYQQRIKLGIYPLSRYGREEIQTYEGVRAFLALEVKEKGKYDPVEATELADLLTEKGIPVCILNACQSGKQINQSDAEDNRETSLASRLMSAGIQMVVAMSYSVTVTAAEIIMKQIYRHLFDKQDLNNAIRLGRKELYNRKARKAYFNTDIELEDWLLPVVYSNGKVSFNLREFSSEEEQQQYNFNLESKYKFTEPTYGFVGRDLDILFIEKALLQHNVLLLQGMGGTGKSTLLNYLQEWWQVTKFAEDTFYVAYDRRAYTLQQIIFEISKQLYSKFDFERFQSKKLNEQCKEISKKLRNESYVLILDNLESVTGQPLAIQNTLDELAREEIRKFLAFLVGGKTKVVLGSRIAEEWLQESTFGDNSYQLKGLDAQARTDLAENILQKVNSSQSLDEIKSDRHFEKLMKLLAGYPLVMEVVLANLKQQLPSEILEQLDKAEIDPGGEDKENNILKCIEYSYDNLSASSQNLLLLLAPFRGFINTLFLSQYAEQLGKLEPFQDYNLEQLEAAVPEAVNWGLLSPIDKDYPQLLTIQPVLPYFLQTKLKKVDEETRTALQEGFKNHYKVLADYYNKLMESKEPQDRQMGIVFVRWEYENLYQALQICLCKEETIFYVLNCLNNYLESINDRVAQLHFLQSTYGSLSKYALENHNQQWEKEMIGVSDSIAKCYVLNKDDQQAQKAYLQSLEKTQQLQEIEPRRKQVLLAGIYHQLGYLAQESRQYKQATGYYQQALSIYIEYGDRYSQAKTYHQLGGVAEESRQYKQATGYYQQALSIYIEYGDRYSQARTYQGLGTVALRLRDYSQANDYYQQALSIYIEYGDRYSQARTYRGLGTAALRLGEYSQANDYYQKALSIYIEYDDRYSQALTYHNLGNLAYQLRDYEQAHDYYQQALEIKIEYGDRYSQAITLQRLGAVAQELRHYEQAHDYYQQALDIFIEYGDRYSQGNTYGQLGMLAEELSEFEQAKSYYLQALGIFVEFEDQQNGGLTISKLASLYQKTQDNNLLSEVAAMFDMTEAEVRELFEKFKS